MRRWLLALAVLALVAAFLASGLARHFTPDGVRAAAATLAGEVAARPGQSAALYVAAYAAMTAVSLPVAAAMSLAAGALFGFGQGLLLALAGASLGGLLAFLLARYLLRGYVQARWSDRLRAVNAGLEREGASYLFALRLTPVFPFFVVNLLMGLGPMRAGTFFTVSVAGMAPAAAAYVNAGTQLAEVQSGADILSAPLIGSLVLIGLLPLAASRLLAAWKRRRAYRGWSRPRRFDRNLIVIGGGAAGLVSAWLAAASRAKVTLVEAGRMGGDCLNTGCVPSKALIESARLAARMRDAGRWGLEPVQPQVSHRVVMARVREAIARIEPHDSAERYAALGVEVIAGHARLLDPWTVEVRPHKGLPLQLTARSIVLATGAEPALPAIPGIEDSGAVTSATLWDALEALEAPPARTVVLGGGAAGVELAQALARLGSAVSLVEERGRLLPAEDEDASALVRAVLEQDGVEVITGRAARRCVQEHGRRMLELDGEPLLVLDYDLLLCATGRRPRLAGFGLEELGIPVDRPLEVNDFLETAFPHILAAGDVAGPFRLTHAAAHQAWYASTNALFGALWRFRADYRVLPRVVHCDPPVATVGLTEHEARARGIAFETTRYELQDLDRAIVDGETRGFVKVLTVPGRDRILGATVAGTQADGIVAEFALAMRGGLGLGRILSTVHAYPGWNEAAKAAAGEWRRARVPAGALRLAAIYHAWRRR